ncbi:putative glucan 1,4-alpha-glucosidase [Helianthus annuus]|nr:putative glucan 1,4-alpha-glucosidase [Helianthus annuus]
MEALMGSSSYLKLLSNSSCSNFNNNNFFTKPHPFHTIKPLDFKLSVSSRTTVRPLSLSSSHAQAEVDHHKLLIQDSPNGYTVEAETQTVGVQFQLRRECSFGQNFLITGDHPILGLWDPNNAVPLTWSDGHIWTVHLDIPIGKCIKFKLIMQESDGKYVWQPGPDRVLECFQTDKIITLCEDWENPDSRTIIETDPSMNQEIQFVEPSVGTTVTEEPNEYAINMKEVLVSDEVVPVLVPGLSQLPLDEGPDDEPEPANGAAMTSTGHDMAKVVPGLSQLPVNEGPVDEPEPTNGAAMVSAGPDMAKDLTLPELDSKRDIANTSNSNPRPEISSIQENQESCENKHQEMQVAEELQDHQATQPMISLLHNDIHWSTNVMQKFLNIFGIQ